MHLEISLGVAICVIVCLVAYGLGKIGFRKDTESEKRKRGFLVLAQALASYGLKDIPEILNCLAVGDYSGAYEIVRFYVVALTKQPGDVIKIFDGVFERVLTEKLKSPESLAYLEAKLADAKKAAVEKKAA